MAPLDPEYHNYNVLAGFVISSYTIAVLTSLLLIARTLTHAYYGIPIALRTRSRDPLRRKDLLTTAALAALSFGLNMYHVVDALITSYSAWAHNIELLVPTNVWTASAWFPFNEQSEKLRLGQWFKETDWLQEISFAIGGRSRDFWWAQQLSAATMIWSVYVAVEARRRNIPHAFVFILLAHLVGLSTAQNLFQIVVLLAPLPIERPRRRVKASSSSKPITWTPYSIFLLLPFVLAMVSTAVFPYVFDHFFLALSTSIPLIMTFVPLFISTSSLIPITWGKTHDTIHHAHRASLPTFAISARFSTALHIMITAASLFFNTPPKRHQDPATLLWSKFLRALPTEITGGTDYTVLSSTTRARIAITRLLGSLSDNPVVRKIGWDVLLSLLSLCIWAGFRSLDASHVLAAAGVPGIKNISSIATDLANTAQDLASSATEATGTALTNLSESTADLRATAKDYADTAAASFSEKAKQFSEQASAAANTALDAANETITRYGIDDTVTQTLEAASSATRRARSHLGLDDAAEQIIDTASNLTKRAKEQFGLSQDDDEALEQIKDAATRGSKRAVSGVKTAASKAANSSPVKRGARAAKNAVDTATSTASAVSSPIKRAARRGKANADAPASTLLNRTSNSDDNNEADDLDDPTYSASVDGDYHDTSADEHDYEHEEHPVLSSTEELAEGAESGALAWGLAMLGGLGTAVAGVYGADLVVR